MEDLDEKTSPEQSADDYQLLMNNVVCEEPDLFYIDCYLRELFHGK